MGVIEKKRENNKNGGFRMICLKQLFLAQFSKSYGNGAYLLHNQKQIVG